MPFFKIVQRVSFDGNGYLVEEGRWDADGDTLAEVGFDTSGNFSVGAATAQSIQDAEFRADVAGNDVIVNQVAGGKSVSITMLGTDTGYYTLRGKAA